MDVSANIHETLLSMSFVQVRSVNLDFHPNLSRTDFSSHGGTYYNPQIGKQTQNPEQ